MTDLERQVPTQLTLTSDEEAISHLRQAIASGKHWYIALLEAIGLWGSAEETYDGRTWRYLIDGEAFDWRLLAQRLCEAVTDLIPEDERDALLFRGRAPLNITKEDFQKLIGNRKYHQYLNYFYGVTVEESLILAVQEEVRKERRALGLNSEYDTTDEAYCRIYDAAQVALLQQFRQEKGYPRPCSITLTELKEFTYWLFKYRLKQCDKARVASDTNKALSRLKGRDSYL